MATEQVLNILETEISKQNFKDVKPLRVDKYLASSCLQKSIRRNDLKTALSAAFTLLHQDKNSFWRRLHTISVEDVGVASPDAVTQTLMAFNNPAWRKKVSDLQVGLHLTKLLCTSVKIRLGDEIYTICNKATDLQSFRQVISQWSDQALADYVLGTNTSLPERALCLWLLAGTKRFPSDTLPKRTGSLETIADVLLALNAPADLTNSCLGTMTKTQWPLVLFTPLLWTDMNKEQNLLRVCTDPYSVSPAVNGVPLASLDMFTRIGRASFNELRKSLPEIHSFKIQQIGLAVFYSEGYCVDQRATSKILEEYRQAGELADAEGLGLDIPEYLGLKGIIIQNTDLLNTLRHKQLKNYFCTSQGKLSLEDAAA